MQGAVGGAFNRNRNSSEIYNQKGNYKIANKFMYEWKRERGSAVHAVAQQQKQ